MTIGPDTCGEERSASLTASTPDFATVQGQDKPSRFNEDDFIAASDRALKFVQAAAALTDAEIDGLAAGTHVVVPRIAHKAMLAASPLANGPLSQSILDVMIEARNAT